MTDISFAAFNSIFCLSDTQMFGGNYGRDLWCLYCDQKDMSFSDKIILEKEQRCQVCYDFMRFGSRDS